MPERLAPDFYWAPEEIVKIGRIQRLLNVSLQVASDAVKFFLRLVKGHTGEIAVSFVKNLLERFGIRCGHNGKANKFLSLLCQWDWIRVTAREKWHARELERKGRARTYAIGEALIDKFEKRQRKEACVENGINMTLSFTSHRYREPFENLACETLLAGQGDLERNKGSP